MAWIRKQWVSVTVSAGYVVILYKAIVGELPDLYQFLPLPLVNVREQVKSFPNRHRSSMNRHTQIFEILQSNNDAQH